MKGLGSAGLFALIGWADFNRADTDSEILTFIAAKWLALPSSGAKGMRASWL